MRKLHGYKKQKEDEYSAPEIILPSFLPDSTLPYLGKNYNLRLVSDNERKNSIEIIDDDNLLIFVDNSEIDKDKELLKIKLGICTING